MDNSVEILNTLEGTIDRLKVIYSEGGRAALNDNVAEVRQLCISVEEVLRHQQKEKVNFWGERRDYWHYLSEVVSKMKTLDGCVKRVQGLPQLTSAQGKGRALIRECLTEQLLAECIQNSLSNVKRTRDWYLPHSVLNTDSLSQRVLNALYDLSDVTFDLPSDGLDLDETWPSFVLKSFQHRNGTADIQKQNTTMSPILKVLGGSTQVARVADKDRPKVSKLEHAVEEEATEIYVRHEIPFNLELVGTLLSNIHQDLTSCGGTQGDHAPFFQSNKPLPQLQVTKMDDITSCLALLKDYITSWSHDICKKGGKLIDENKSLRDKQADLEMQLQETILESESSETGLVEQLQTSREELKSVSADLQRLTEENQRLTTELSQTREKVQELEVANFDLEEQLVRCSSSASEAEGEKERQRAFTIVETSLQEKEQELTEITHRLAEAESVREQLQRDLSDAHTSLDNQRLVYESRQRSEERIEQLQSELADRNEQEVQLKVELAEIQSKNQSLAKELETVRFGMEREIQKLEQESAKWASVEAERDHMKAELAEVNTLIEDSTSALKFKLSSQSIELQQVKEQSSKKDRTLAELRGQVRNLESQLGEVTERCESSEQQVEELKRELQDVESVLQDSKEEMSSMHQQLTEKTVSRDLERESMLKSQLAWDSVRDQLLKDKTGLKQQLERLTSENDEIRRALQKLLEQKVTLWQHADDLEQEQVAMGMWLDSKVITECMNCNLTFTLFARKHHCRSCGKVFCTKCCDKKIQLAVSKDPSRVCESCYKRIVQKRMPFAASVINNMDSVALLSTVVNPTSQPHPQKSGSATPTHLAGGCSGPSTGRTSPVRNVSSNSLNIERTIDWSGNSLQAKLLVQNQDSDLDSQSQSRNSPLSTLQSDSNTSLTATLRVPYQAPPTVTSPVEGLEDSDIPPSSYKSVNSMEYSVDPESMRRENERAELESKGGGTETALVSDFNTNFSISSVPGETIDESYYLIETTPHGDGGDPLLGGGEGTFPVGLNNPGSTSLDVNALASKLASLEGYGASQSGGVAASERRLSTDSAGRVGCTDVTEVMMEGGGVHKVPVKVEQHGTSIAWEFSTEPKGIAFGICYRESRTSTREDEVLPLKRCVSHKATLTGEYCAQKKGVYILKFDNCHSKYSGRKLLYKVWTKSPT